MALHDTLANMQEQERQNAEFEKNKPAMIRERQDRISALLKEISEYLQDYTQARTIAIAKQDCAIDDVLGRYNLPLLTITAFGKVICVDPSGPGRIGFPDSVDVYRRDRGAESQREVLAWLRDARQADAPSAWYIRSTAAPQQTVALRQAGGARRAWPPVAQQQSPFELVTKENFSNLIERLLQ